MTITCPCGTEFEKAPGRGRPPKWCPACRLYKSTRPVEASESDDDATPARDGFTPKGRPYDPHDNLTPQERDRVEDLIEEIDRKYRYEIVPNKETLWPGLSSADQSSACIRWHHQAMVEAYESVRPKWWQRSGS
ncbi:MAG: hypothetical protein E6Q97_34325 [Desulfurellales bacterium]|nr:MAG: hypothetical protein E6Q97_34325 [Desulfurellales bacterium]